MKENKKIDNRMKAKKLAAYTLATCMTVTVAPIGAVTPIMAQEVQSELYGAVSAVDIDAAKQKFEIKNNITAGMKFRDAINKITATDVSADSIGTLVSNKITIKVVGESASMYTTGTNDNTIGEYKFEAGKKYEITAEFDLSGYNTIANGEIPTTDSKITLTATDGTDKLELTKYVVDLTSSSTALKLDEYPCDAAGNVYYLRNGKGEIQKDVTTVAHQPRTGEWLYVENGKVTTPTQDVVVDNANGKWLIKSGTNKVNFSLPAGIATDADGVEWYFDRSKAQTGVTDVVRVGATDYNIVAGKVLKKETIAHKKSTNQWLYINDEGIAATPTDGLYKNENGTWYVTGGEVLFTDEGIKTNPLDGKDYFLKNSKVDTTKNGTVFGAGGLKTIKNGVVQTTTKLTAPTVAHNPDDGTWWAVNRNGAIDGRPGLSKNEYGTWLVDDSGQVVFKAKGLVIDAKSTVSSDPAKIYYVENGKVDFKKTGFVTYTAGTISAISVAAGQDAVTSDTVDGTFYVENGVVTGKKVDNNVIHDVKTGAWLYVDTTGENVDFDDIAKNGNGIWKLTDGAVTFKETGVFTDTNGVISNDNTKDYYFENSKLNTKKTGLVQVDPTAGDGKTNLAYVNNGVVSGLEPKNSVVHYQPTGDWYQINDDGDITGSNYLGANANGIWKLNAGKVDFSAETFYTVDTTDEEVGNLTRGDVIYIKGGKFQSNVTGLVTIGTDTRYVKNGVVSDGITDIVQSTDGNWYMVEDGVPSTFTGLAANKNGVWYVKSGVVDFNKTGIVGGGATGDYKDADYYVEKGQMKANKNGIISVGAKKYLVKDSKIVTGTKKENSVINGGDGKWYYVDTNGNVDTNYTGFAGNENGVWYIKNGVVDFEKEGIVASDSVNAVAACGKRVALKTGKDIYVSGGKWQSGFSGVLVDGETATLFTKGYKETMPSQDVVYLATDGKYYVANNGTIVRNKVIATFTTDADETQSLYCENGRPVKRTGIVTLTGGAKKYVVNGVLSDNTDNILVTYAGKKYVVKANGVIPTSGTETVGSDTYDINPDGTATKQ